MGDLFCPPGHTRLLAATLQSANAVRAEYGITRIADITHLDRLGLSVINVVVPESPRIIGVYSGKGITKDEAAVSGLMEALERQICARCDSHRVAVPVAKIRAYLDLSALGWTSRTGRDRMRNGRRSAERRADRGAARSGAVPANRSAAFRQTPVIGALAEQIRRAGLRFRLLCYANGNWPVAMLACIIDPDGGGMFYHLGMGCSWSPLHAATRAITEAGAPRRYFGRA